MSAAETVPAAAPATIDYPPLSPELTGGWLALARVFGPGVVIASVTVGTGETVFAPRMGALFGYTMFWVVLAAVVAKGLLVYSGARHLVLTGEHPMAAWARVPGPRGWLPGLIGLVAFISFPMWIALLAGAVGRICIWVTGLGAAHWWGPPLWATLVVGVTMLLALLQTYDILERVSFAFLAFKVLFILAACLVVRPDWLAALAGLVPHWPALPDWAAANPDLRGRAPVLEVATLLGTVGGGLQDYLGYVACMREKPWGVASAALEGGPQRLPAAPEQVARGRAWLRAPAADIAFSFAAVFVMTGLFMLLGAALLHPQHQVPTDRNLYGQQAQFLGVVHPALVHVYKAAVFFAMLGAVYGCFEVYARSLYEPLRVLRPDRPLDYARLRFWNTLYCGLGGLAVLWTGIGTVALANIVSPLTGVLGCGLWCLAMLAVDATQMPRGYRMGAALRLALLVAGLALAGAGAYTTYTSFR